MARGSGNRDVTLTLSIETLGQEGIQALEGSVRQLAEQGGDAAPQFQVLADELQRLGAQNAALQGFKELTDQTAQLEARQQAAAAAVAEMQQRLLALAEATQRASTEQNEAQATVVRTRTALTEATAALTNLRAQFQGAAKNTEEYKNKFTELLNAQSKAKIEYDAAKDALKQQNAALREAETSQSRLEGQIVKRTAAEKAATAAVEKHSAVMLQASEAAQKLGLSTENVAQAEAQLLASFNQVGSAAGGIVSEMARLADAEAEAAKAAAQLEQSLKEQSKQLLALDPEVQALNASLIESANQAAKLAREQEQLAASAAEMAEADRLLAIQERALNDLRRQGADALDAERAAIREAEQASNLYVAAKRREEQAQKEAAAAARQAAEQIDAAFRTLGTRSVAAVRQEIEQVRAAMATAAAAARSAGDSMAGAFAAGNARIKELEREIRQLSGTLTVADRAASLFKNSLGQIAAGNIIADAVGYLVNKVKEMGREFLEANLAIQRFNKALKAIYGDTDTAASQLAFLRQVAKNAGVSVGDLSDSFIRFSAATKSAGISVGDSNKVFSALARATGTLGLTSDQATGALEALGQMASKGTVSMEELRQQLGDRLPGALGIAAEAMGVSTERLIKMVETGTVSAKVFLPAFADAISQTFGGGTEQINGFIQGWNRLKNALTEVAQQASNTRFFDNMGRVFDLLAENIGGVVTALTLLAERFLILKSFDLAASFVKSASAAAANTAAFAANTAAAAANTAARKANDVAVSVTHTAAATAATVANTAAAVANTAATAANTVARTANAAAMSATAAGIAAATAASTAATAATTRLASVFGGLASAGAAAASGLRTLVGFLGGLPGVLALTVLNAREFGTAIGENTARLFGWGRQLEENEKKLLAQAKAEQRAATEAARLAEQQKRAEQAALGLSGESEKLVDDFAKVAKSSGSTAEALKHLTSELRFDDLKGIEAAGRALNALGKTGKLTADEIKKAFEGALSGKDLAIFEANARAAFSRIKDSSDILKRALDAIADESLRRVGTSVLEITTGFSSAMNSAINDTDRLQDTLKELGVESRQAGVLLAKSFDKQIELANTRVAIDSVIERMQVLSETGDAIGPVFEKSFAAAIDKAIQLADTADDLKRVEDQIRSIIAANPKLAESFQQSFDTIKKKIAELSPQMKQLAADAKLLGVSVAAASNEVKASIEDQIRAYERLKASGKATANEVKEAFVALAKRAIEANQGIVPEWVKVEAAIRGVEIGVDNAGKATAEFAEKSRGALRGVREEAEKTAASLSSVYEAETKARADKIAANRLQGATYDKEGWATDSKGNRTTYGTYLPPPTRDGPWTWVPALNQGYKFGGYWRNDKGTIYTGMSGSDKPFGSQFFNYLGAPMSNLGVTLGPPPKAYEEYNAAGLTTVGPSRAPGAGSSSSTSAAPTSGTPVTINIAGRKLGTVNVASRADADNLASILAGLENAKGNGA